MKTRLLLSLSLVLLFLTSCKKLEGDPFDAYYNYDVLWKTLDERYCFFEYKQVNWDSLYPIYRHRLRTARSSDGIFKIYCDLMAHLKDGHVNLSSAGNLGRYWKWFENYPRAFSQDVLEKFYLKNDYRIAAGFSYTLLRTKTAKKIGYIRYESFSNSFGLGNISSMFDYFKDCCGLVIDIRQNGGGDLRNAQVLSGCFTNQALLYGYIQHKTGPAHNAFSDPVAQWIYPEVQTQWNKPVVLLTNRNCYSAANSFASMMALMPMVTLMGDTTGGGGGMPLGSELPCGWSLRFSAIPMLDKNKQPIENGVAPDRVVSLDTNALKMGIDSMIESAADFLQSQP